MRRWIVLGYGVLAYVGFLGVFLYAIGFIGNLGVPRAIDSAPQAPFSRAILINAALLTLFAMQHSVMARPTFKRWWTQFIPVPLERSTYVLASNICLILLFAFWQPMGGILWDAQGAVSQATLTAVFFVGWMMVLITTFLINHLELFGLQQVWNYFQGKQTSAPEFVTPGPYRFVRHPLYVGWLIAFWATPIMTAAHLMFAIMTTAYILVAIQLEERNLVEAHGEAYAQYRREVPMLVPRIGGTGNVDSGAKAVTMFGE